MDRWGSDATWQEDQPSEAKTWHGWDGSSWHTESEAKTKTWQDAWHRSTTRAWQHNAEVEDTELTPKEEILSLKYEILALMKQVSKLPLLMEEVLELKTQVSELPLLKEEVLELKTQVSELNEALEQNKQKEKHNKTSSLDEEEVLELKTQVSELNEALEQNKQKEKHNKTPSLDASSSATNFVSSPCGWHGPGDGFDIPYGLTSCGEGQCTGDFAKHWQSMHDTVGFELAAHGIQGWLDRMWATAEKNQHRIRHNWCGTRANRAMLIQCQDCLTGVSSKLETTYQTKEARLAFFKNLGIFLKTEMPDRKSACHVGFWSNILVAETAGIRFSPEDDH
jgi:hypothetical protein